jgi:hypothetical protein
MAKFKIKVVEEVTATYAHVEIEADSYDQACEIAEEMRVQGELGDPQESVDEVFYREL